MKQILTLTLGIYAFFASAQTHLLDSTFHYQVEIPSWLKVFDYGSKRVWGGLLPAVEGIEDVIAIKSFEKNQFESWSHFKKVIVEDMVLGQKPEWGDYVTCMGKTALGKWNGIGDAYKVYVMIEGLIYHSQYVLVETPTAYLWIEFTATKETYEKNLDKFKTFLEGFKIK
jgi:hypothetical protein